MDWLWRMKERVGSNITPRLLGIAAYQFRKSRFREEK